MNADEPLDDLNEDLFDFDELLRDAELFGDATDAQAAPPEAAPAAALPAVAAATATHRPPRRPPPVPPRTVPVAVAAVESGPFAAAVHAAQPEPRTQVRVSRGLALTLCGAAALNLTLLVLVFEALGTVRGMARESERPAADASAEPERGLRPEGDSIAPPDEGVAALERAAELSANGEHQRARESLYALLAVCDRLSAESRLDVEARARLLIADSWRLEADALESELAALASEQEPPR